MKHWPRAKLGVVAPLVRRAVDIDANTLYPELGIRSFGRGTFHKPPLSGLDAGTKRLFRIEPGDLVFSNVFSWEGAVAVASPNDEGRFGSHRFITCDVDRSCAEPVFLCSYLTGTLEGLDQLRQASPGGAGRNRTLGLEKLAEIEVPLPPLAEQQLIVAHLDALVDKSLRLDAHITTIEAVADRLLIALATRSDLTDEDRHAQGWIEGRLGQVLESALDPVTVNADESYPNVGVLNFARGLFSKPPIAGSITSASRLYRIRAGQFLYSRLFAFEGAYAIVGKEHDGAFVSNEFPTFTIDPIRASPAFLYAYFRSPHVWEQLTYGSKGLGDRRQRVQPPQLLNHKLWLPPPSQLKLLDAAVPKIAALKARHTSVRAANTALLPAALERLFTAESLANTR